MFGRKRKDAETAAGANPGTTVTVAPGGEPLPPMERVRPEDAVLDELSRAFGVSASGDAENDNGTDDQTAEHDTVDATTPSESDPLAEATEPPVAESLLVESPVVESSIIEDLRITPADGSSPATDENAPIRPTITIGGDDASLGLADSVPLNEALGRPVVLGTDASVPDVSTDRRVPITIGANDELPDAVYLDEELGIGDGSGGTVFIDDDGTGDAIAPKDATGRGIEPRLRQRRIGVRRAESRRRLRWVALGAVVLVVLLAVLTVLGSGLFAIDKVSVGGNVYTDREQLNAVIAELEGTPVLLADTEGAEAALEAIPWVADARVRAKFPDRATIEIRERKPVATMRGADGLFRVLDAEGRVLDVIEGQPVAYVLIAGPGTLDLAAGDFAPIGQSSAAALVTKLTPTVRPRVESLEVTADGSDLVMNLAPAPDDEQTSTIRVRFGSAIGDTDQIEKLVRLEKQLDDLPQGTVSEINVATSEVTVL